MIAPTVEREMIDHAIEEFPRESCGVVRDDKYCPQINVHENPEKGFRMDREVWTYGVYPGESKLQAVIHSHPNGPECPSMQDMVSQISSAIPWGIISTFRTVDEKIRGTDPFWFGNGVLAPPLLGRKFRHGVTDCYSLIRDWYKLNRDVTLDEIPRAWEWWENGRNLYMDGFARAGFEEVLVHNRPLVGDIALICIGSKIVNHAGVYVGEGRVMHHPASRRSNGYDETSLSRVEPIGPYLQRIARWVRHKK